jgi:hypothetical protein
MRSHTANDIANGCKKRRELFEHCSNSICISFDGQKHYQKQEEQRTGATAADNRPIYILSDARRRLAALVRRGTRYIKCSDIVPRHGGIHNFK